MTRDEERAALKAAGRLPTRDEAIAKWRTVPESTRNFVMTTIAAAAIAERRDGNRDDLLMEQAVRAAGGTSFHRSPRYDLADALETVYMLIDACVDEEPVP